MTWGRAAAIHEAGHATVAYGIGVRGLRAVLEPNGGGFVVYGEPGTACAGQRREYDGAGDDYAVTASMFTLAIVLAGQVAQGLAGLDGHQPWYEGGDRDQIEGAAVDLVEVLGAPAALAPRIIRCGEQDVTAWLEQSWPAVMRVADALHAEQQLDGARIATLAGPLPRPALTTLQNVARSLWTRYGARRQRAAVVA